MRLEIEGAGLPDEIDERRRHARGGLEVEDVSERDCRRARYSRRPSRRYGAAGHIRRA